MNCGTLKGLKQHEARNERPCRFCLPFMDESKPKASVRRRGTAPGTVPVAPCGTYTAFRKHKRNGEPVDADCQKANDEFNADRRARRAQKKEAA